MCQDWAAGSWIAHDYDSAAVLPANSAQSLTRHTWP